MTFTLKYKLFITIVSQLALIFACFRDKRFLRVETFSMQSRNIGEAEIEKGQKPTQIKDS